MDRVGEVIHRNVISSEEEEEQHRSMLRDKEESLIVQHRMNSVVMFGEAS